jgi:glycosyltransferase involved in cell wall biosynthesis
VNILYLCQHFEVGDDPGSERHFYFCKYSVAKGHNATAITSNVDYKNAKVKIEGTKGTVRRVIAGVEIDYVYSYARFRGSFLKRALFYITFVVSSLARAMRVRKPDVVYAVSTPITVGFLGYVISRIRRAPFIFEVTDVWPDAAVACGVLKSRTLIGITHWLEMFCYAKAAHIVGLTRGICDNIIAKGIDARKVSLITNGVDVSLFSRSLDLSGREVARASHGFADHFVAMYLGAHGAYNSLRTIIDAAIVLRDDPRFLFAFVGGGDEKVKLERRVAQEGLGNVRFFAPIPRHESVAMLAAADAFLLPNRKGEFFTANLPNKLFDFMASGKPIVVAGRGESADLILKAGCGRATEAEDSAGMARALLELAGLPPVDREAIGRRGREYVLAHYDRAALSERFLRTLADARKCE